MKQHDYLTSSSQGSRDMRRDPQTRDVTRKPPRERERRYTIMIDEAPREGLYVQVCNEKGQVIAALLPPTTGHLELHFSDGLFRGGKVCPIMEKV